MAPPLAFPFRRALGALLLLLVPWGAGAARGADDDYEFVRKAFRAAQADPDWKKRREAYVRLADFDRAESAVEILGALAKEASPTVVRAGLDGLSSLRSHGARDALLASSRKGRHPEALYALRALGAQGAQGGPEVEAGLLEAAKGGQGAAAAQAAWALRLQPASVSVPVLGALLGHKDWQVRRAAARALALHKAEAALAPLALALETEKGRVRADLMAALTAISGQDLGYDPPAWKALAAGGAPGPSGRKPAPPPSLFGVPIYGQRVVVCFDASLRMGDPHPFTERDRLRALCTPPDGTPIFFGRMVTILDFARGHVKHWLDGLEGGTRIEVLTYNEKVSRLLGKLSAAGSAPRKLVGDALDALVPDNGIAAYGALDEALEIAGGGDAGAWKAGPDEILFLGASTPNTGELSDADAIAAAVGLKAALRQVPIHMVGIHTHPYGMYKSIAEQTGGVYVDLTR